MNKRGKIKMQFSRHAVLFTDTFYRTAIIADSARGIIAINRKGKTLFGVHVFDNGPDPESEGLYRIKQGNKYGFASTKGMAIRPKFDLVMPFKQGLAAFVVGGAFTKDNTGEYTTVSGGKWGFIDKKGKVVIPAQFDHAADFDGGMAEVTINGLTTYIDRQGRKVCGPPAN